MGRSEERGEAFAGTSSPKVGIADGVTMTVVEMSMSESRRPCDFPQTYIFDHHEAQAVSHSVPTKWNCFFNSPNFRETRRRIERFFSKPSREIE